MLLLGVGRRRLLLPVHRSRLQLGRCTLQPGERCSLSEESRYSLSAGRCSHQPGAVRTVQSDHTVAEERHIAVGERHNLVAGNLRRREADIRLVLMADTRPVVARRVVEKALRIVAGEHHTVAEEVARRSCCRTLLMDEVD